jgi:hypothetical protein
LCGLPLLYRDSGCLPEYCTGFGMPFNPETFETALGQLMSNYADLTGRMRSYPHTAERMTANWLTLMKTLYGRRQEIAKNRRPLRSPWAFARNQIPL